MAQREKEETELQAPETLTLCVNNCGFYGNPATNNMCKTCFKASAASASASACACSSASASATICSSPPPSVSVPEKPRADPKRSRPDPAAAQAARKVKRCARCTKRVGLTGFRCRCGELFCGEHRYSDRHACVFDYKTAGREAIARENPLVRASKIIKI
ncbi:zinc finger A20 and AN1 domain-containing stress-associated protein 11-like [Ananas comosus]|uniref:Zinc finger A20 and AN1 domain-containing stress-associated protein 1 n=1 Tax=Ananas comosus TaxID=4615 RepID=A0A199W7M7_ANACO|nr:zinc finger A20 and AN1 domain-containing stress-associated protein 11-like [Ananas comosus]OAY85208.1 Zinc finger A20 and AN1 domain-containing stress-associated protein 1 [Ananas comosus]